MAAVCIMVWNLYSYLHERLMECAEVFFLSEVNGCDAEHSHASALLAMTDMAQ